MSSRDLEQARWWKRFRRGTLAYVLNLRRKDAGGPVEVVTSQHVADFEAGKRALDKSDVSFLSLYLGVDLQGRRRSKYRRI